MANPFDAALPSVGQKPWTLNPAILELRGRQGTVEDVIYTGRLSASGLAEAIGEAASGIEANDTTVADLIATPSSETSAAVDAKIDPVASDVSDLNTLTSTGRLSEAGLSATIAQPVNTIRRLAAIPASRFAFPPDASTLPAITNSNSLSGSLTKTWAATLTEGPLAWHGPVAAVVVNGGIGSSMPNGGPTTPIITWEWVTDAPLFAISAVFGNGAPHILTVDGELVTTAGAIQGNNAYQLVNYGTLRKLRHYTLTAGGGFIMRGIVTTAVDTVIRPDVDMQPLAACFMDSWGMGTPTVGTLPASIPYLTGRLLGWRLRSAPDGGTGYVNNGVSGGSNVLAKIPTLDGVALDAGIFGLGLNDPVSTQTQINALAAAAEAAFTAFRTAHESAAVYVLGPWKPPGEGATPHAAKAGAIQQAAANVGAFHIPTTDWFTGTGKIGAETGDGNSDVLIGPTDYTHPNQPAGSSYVAVRIAEAIKRVTVEAARSAA